MVDSIAATEEFDADAVIAVPGYGVVGNGIAAGIVEIDTIPVVEEYISGNSVVPTFPIAGDAITVARGRVVRNSVALRFPI